MPSDALIHSHVRTVHLVFKTHFDYGFTDFAEAVLRRYLGVFIPGALRTAEHFRNAAGRARYVWTTGAWLIHEFLERSSAAERVQAERAIAEGLLAWHALPFTLHSELTDASLFKHGLRFAKRLDARFGRRTIAAKMTDVPGHTRAIVPLLANAGIEFLHIGVNRASAMPEVPPVFVWRDEASGTELIVMYQHAYGGTAVLEGCDAALIFAHTEDNLGPHAPADVEKVFAEARAQFPQAEVQASTLDAYARELRTLKPRLPIVTAEIGDSWIHGVGSDPTKMRGFLELSRLRLAWLESPRNAPPKARLDAFSDALLLVAEHTWGLDAKVHLADERTYPRDTFDLARPTEKFRRFERSWLEQRDYLQQALKTLEDTPFASEARSNLQRLEPSEPDLSAYQPADPGQLFETKGLEFRVDDRGALCHLQEKHSGELWATEAHPLGLFSYQTFDQTDYDRFLAQYVDTSYWWATPDFSRPGLAGSEARQARWYPKLESLYWRETESDLRFLLDLRLPRESHEHHGAPARVVTTLTLPRAEPHLGFDLQWFNKPANRQPEALWFSFVPKVPEPERWQLTKMRTTRVAPSEVVPKGNRLLHAVLGGMHYADAQRSLHLESLDAPLVSVGRPTLLHFNEAWDPRGGLHVNLFNNVWGTNFPMWFGEDARFRFVCTFAGPQGG